MTSPVMNRVNTVQQHIAASAKGTPSFTKEEIVAKRSEGLVWIVIKDKVYDVTNFLDEHPGGAELITDIAADDFKTMTVEFDDADHSEEAFEQLEPLFVGMLAKSTGAAVQEEEEEEEEEEEPHLGVPFDPAKPFGGPTAMTLTLLQSEDLSHDVTVYRFALPRPSDEFSLTIGKHIVLSFEDNDGKNVSRAYTPVSPYGDTGFIDFLIKRYPNGKMSEHLKVFRPGIDSIKMSGPKGRLGYLGNGDFTLRRKGHNEQLHLKHVTMLAGGSGITPMFQIIQAIVRNPADKLKITLIFANKTAEDIILFHPLNEFARLRPDQIKIVYTLDNPPAGWKGEKGFITENMLRAHTPAPSADSMVFLCGPPPMIKKACVPALKSLNWPAEAIFKF